MFYIYHVKGVKVGCTDNLERRVEKEQGYSKKDYEVLASTADKMQASNLEVYWQNALGYKIDNNPYYAVAKLNTHITGHSVTFGNAHTRKEDLPTLLEALKTIKINNTNYDLDKKAIDFIMDNLIDSHVGGGPYVYTKKLVKFLDTKETNSIEEFELIRDWARKRGLYDKGDAMTQFAKLAEEQGELAQALLKSDREGIIDAIGDMVVVLTNLTEHCNIEGGIEFCISSAYNEIKDRKGKMINGTFVKEQ